MLWIDGLIDAIMLIGGNNVFCGTAKPTSLNAQLPVLSGGCAPPLTHQAQVSQSNAHTPPQRMCKRDPEKDSFFHGHC